MSEDFKVIDLTLTLDEGLPCNWPTHMPFQRKTWNWYQRAVSTDGLVRDSRLGPYFTEWLLMDEHVGTHFDAPSHFIPHPVSGFEHAGPAGAITGEKVELERLMGDAVVIDATKLRDAGANGESPWISRSLIEEWEQKHGAINKDEIVLFHTGWDQHYLAGQAGDWYFENPLVNKTGAGWPAPSVEAVRYLYEKGVRCIGTDGASMGAAHDGAPVHFYGLDKGLIYVEALCNLDKLSPRGSYFIFLPLKIAGSSGSPGRAIAFLGYRA